MKESNKGFTLLEILITTSILVALCFFSLTISNQVIEAWEKSSKNLSNELTINLGLDIIEEDLETAFPCFWTYHEQNGNLDNKDFRYCFLKKAKNSKKKAITYEVGFNSKKNIYGLYRYEKEINNNILFSPTELLTKEILIPSNLLVRDITKFSMQFLYKDKDGNIIWTSDNQFCESPICAKIIITTIEERQFTRLIPIIVERL